MMRKYCALLLLLAGATPVSAQDPLSIERGLYDLLSRRLMDQEADRQLQRYQDQREAAYDRMMCIQVGYRGPEVDLCVRDSAAMRRGPRQGGPGFACFTDTVDGTSVTICD